MTSLPLAFDSVARSLSARFQRDFGAMPKLFRAPGRVNLIGEHIDYNDGFVMPAALEFNTWVAAAAREDHTLRAQSLQFDAVENLQLDSLAGAPGKDWGNFVRGVAAVLLSAGHKLSGANLLIDGQVPIGAGLSSSASLEVATALTLLSVSQSQCAPLDLVRLCQRAEHEYVGTRCGIMDQFVAVFGRSGHALLLDCRSLKHEFLAIPADVRLVICNSMVRHELAAGEYNRRRADCEAGVRVLQKRKPGIAALRDATLSDLEASRQELSEVVFRRCRHVIGENERVLAAAEALRADDLSRFGRLMYESHCSLRDDYEVSCRELDLLVEIASACDGVYGARMTGGGFGGCIIALARSDCTAATQAKLRQEYQRQTGIKADIYVCTASQGAGVWPPGD